MANTVLVNNQNSNEVTRDEKNYGMLNVMRFICAILVIVLHTTPTALFGSTPFILVDSVICRVAVPFYFMTSGYFFYNKFINEDGYLLKYVKKILFIYLSWSAIYFLWRIPGFNKDSIGSFLFELTFRATHFHLWYLISLVMCISFVSLFLRKDKFKSLATVSIVLYIIGLCGDSYSGLVTNSTIVSLVNGYNTIFEFTRNGICFGVIFISMGIFIKKFNLDEKFKSRSLVGFLILLFFVTQFIEAYLLNYYRISDWRNMYISLLFLMPVLFIGLLKSRIPVTKKVSAWCKDISLGIYCCHGIFLILISDTIITLGPNLWQYQPVLKFILVTIFSILLANTMKKS